MDLLRNKFLAINKLLEAGSNNKSNKESFWFNKEIANIFFKDEKLLYSQARDLGQKLAGQIKSGEWNLTEIKSNEAKIAAIIFRACRTLVEIYQTKKDIFSLRVKDFIYNIADEVMESFHLHSPRKQYREVSIRIMNLLNPITPKKLDPNLARLAF